MYCVVTVFILVVMVMLHRSDSAKILMIPADHHSHVNFFCIHAQALSNSGHTVHMLISTDHTKTVEKYGVHRLPFNRKIDNIGTSVSAADFDPLANPSLTNTQKIMTMFAKISSDYCRAVMEDESLIWEMTATKYDLVLVDGLLFFRCLYIIPYRLGVPYITLTAMLDPWTSGLPASPAIEPGQMGLSSSSMTFFERLTNFAMFSGMTYIMGSSLMTDNLLVSEFIPGGDAQTYRELYQRSEMWLVNHEEMCLDYPRISAPHYRFIGGASGVSAAKLPDDIAAIIDNAKHGVIVLSFGSLAYLSHWPKHIADKFMEAFGRLEQEVILRYTGPTIDNPPTNVHILKWIPQNDLLGHENTKLFITHSGNNGQLEALYHGVPMLCFPIIGDQMYNTMRVVTHRYGEKMKFDSFTADELFETISKLISDPEYTKNIKRCSRIVKAQPSPSENLIFWVNHVLEFGSSHLRSPAFDLPMYQLFLWDILLFLCVVFITSAYLLYCCCRCCCRCGAAKQKTE